MRGPRGVPQPPQVTPKQLQVGSAPFRNAGQGSGLPAVDLTRALVLRLGRDASYRPTSRVSGPRLVQASSSGCRPTGP
eukprot:7593505-Alexandrium_andersonii.AAC.1